MTMLRHIVETDIDEAGFKSLIDALIYKGSVPLSSLIGMWLADDIGTFFEHQLVDGHSGNLRSGSAVKSEIFLNEDGVTIVDFVNETIAIKSGFLSRFRPSKKVTLQISAFANNLTTANKLLSQICASIYEILSIEIPHSSMLNERSKYFILQQAKRNADWIEKLKDGVRFVQPDYDEDELNISRLIADGRVREFLLRLVQARGLSEERFNGEISQLESKDALARIALGGGFLRREIVVECRKTNQQIARLEGDEIDLSTLAVRCGGCNRLYKDEKAYSSWVSTEKLSGLLKSSRWMNVLVTSYLVECGIPLDFIFWSVTFGADEIDIVAFVEGSAWAFELKDKEFSSSDAHHFNYRRSIIKPQQAFVVSTDIVSPDAKNVFSEVSGPTPSGTLISDAGRLPLPIMIEGLVHAKETIANKLNEQSTSSFMWRIRGALSGINSNIASILAKKYAPKTHK